MFELRDYQQQSVHALLTAAAEGETSILQAPTGSGKSVMIAELGKRLLDSGHRIFLGTHKREILQQLAAALSHHIPNLDLEVIQAGIPSSKVRWDAQLLLGMIPTAARRLRHLEAAQGRVVILDEAHHLHQGAASWNAVVEALEPAHLMGCTATPVRPNGKGLGAPWTRIIEAPSIRELIEQGHLAPYQYWAAKEQVDTSRCRTRAGDFAIDDIEEAASKILGRAAEAWRAYNPDGHRTLAACVSVAHAMEVARLFNAEGIPAMAVHGSMPTSERDEILEKFRQKDITILTTCALIEEGFDLPSCTVLQWLRPTKSLRLFLQLVGRVLRPAENKEFAIIIDQAGNHRNGLPCDPRTWTLSPDEEVRTGPVDEELVAEPGGQVRRVKRVEEAEFIRLEPGQKAEPKDPFQILRRLQDLSWAHRVRRQPWGRRKQVLEELEALAYGVPLWGWLMAAEILGFKPGWAHRKRLELVNAYIAVALPNERSEWIHGNRIIKQMFRDLCLPRTPKTGIRGKLRVIGLLPSWSNDSPFLPHVVVRASIDPATPLRLQHRFSLEATAAWEKALRQADCPWAVELIGVHRRPWLSQPPREEPLAAMEKEVAQPEPHHPNPLNPPRRRHAQLIRR